MGSIPIRFFRPVFKEYHRRKMELPTAFVEEFGSTQLNTAYLSVSTSDVSWPVNLVPDEKGKIWMKKGWKAFLKHFSVPRGSFLVFEYQGKSQFNVIIMSPSEEEISYTPAPAETPKAKELTGDESDVSFRVMDAVPSNKRKETHHGGQGAKAAEKKPCWSLQEEALRRAEAYVCKNPSFLVVMSKPCIAAGRVKVDMWSLVTISWAEGFLSHNLFVFWDRGMYIPTYFASKYLSGREENTITLQGLDGKTSWSGRYLTGSYTILNTGWRGFATDNRLCIGDVCVFELINVEENTYKVAIFRAYDKDNNGFIPLVKRLTANNQPGAVRFKLKNRNGTRNRNEIKGNNIFSISLPVLRRPIGLSKVLFRTEKAVGALRGRKLSPASKSFTVKMSPSYHKGNYMYIPPQHCVTCLKNHGDKIATLLRDDGKKWAVKVFISGSTGRFTLGWRKFAVDNNLQRGDSCTFELISGGPIRYRVAISRACPTQ